MKIIFDVTSHNPPVTTTRPRGTEFLDWHIARSLAKAGHTVHMVTREAKEYQEDGIFVWPAAYHPHECDVLIMAEELQRLPLYTYDKLYMTLNRIDPALHGHAEKVDGYVVFSDFGAEVLLYTNKEIKPEQVVIIEAGAETQSFANKDMHAALWSNSPDRGLQHIARWWDRVVEEVPDAVIHVTYDLADYYRQVHLMQDELAISAMNIMEWVERGNGVIGHGSVPRDELKKLQRESGLYIYPCDPMHQGEITTAFAIMEALGSGMHCLLSDADSLPSLFGETATIVGTAGAWNDDAWVSSIVDAMRLNERDAWKKSYSNQKWAKQWPWRLNAHKWVSLIEGKDDVRHYRAPVLQSV